MPNKLVEPNHLPLTLQMVAHDDVRPQITFMIDSILKSLRKGETSCIKDAIFELRSGKLSPEQRRDVLMWTWFHGDVAALETLFENGWSVVEIGPDLGLNGACFHGHCSLVKFLLEKGADPNFQQSETLETPLHSAICKASRPQFNRIVQILLKHGANPNQTTKAGVETGAFMRDVRTRGETPLHRAAAYGDVEMLTLLLDAGADKKIRDCNGDSPLSWASWHLRPGVVLKLLAHGQWDIGEWHVKNLTSDHGKGWGNGMENKFV